MSSLAHDRDSCLKREGPRPRLSLESSSKILLLGNAALVDLQPLCAPCPHNLHVQDTLCCKGKVYKARTVTTYGRDSQGRIRHGHRRADRTYLPDRGPVPVSAAATVAGLVVLQRRPWEAVRRAGVGDCQNPLLRP